MIISQERAFLKAQTQLQAICRFVEQAASDGQRIDEAERELFAELLAVGRTLLESPTPHAVGLFDGRRKSALGGGARVVASRRGNSRSLPCARAFVAGGLLPPRRTEFRGGSVRDASPANALGGQGGLRDRRLEALARRPWPAGRETENAERGDSILREQSRAHEIRRIPGRRLSDRQRRGGRSLPPLGEGSPGMHRYALDRKRRPGHAAPARDLPQ